MLSSIKVSIQSDFQVFRSHMVSSIKLGVTCLPGTGYRVSQNPPLFDFSPTNSCQQFEGKDKLKVGKEIFITFDWHSRRGMQQTQVERI